MKGESIHVFRLNLAHVFLVVRSEEHTSELQSRPHLVCRLLLEKKNISFLTHKACQPHSIYTRRVSPTGELRTAYTDRERRTRRRLATTVKQDSGRVRRCETQCG